MDVLIEDRGDFDTMALKAFEYQANHVPIYSDFLRHLKVDWRSIAKVEDIPFLPISLFKTHRVIGRDAIEEIVFFSSGTTGMQQSRHFVQDLSIYNQSFQRGFEYFYGPANQYVFIGLLPSYQEREGSSLIYMVDHFIAESPFDESGYYLNNLDELLGLLVDLENKKQPYIVLGVTYALLDLAERAKELKVQALPSGIIMETGGMKGRRKEMIKQEVHALLMEGLGVNTIHSEFGMTELLSQAYSKGKGVFSCPPWMQVKIREVNDPFTFVNEGLTGGLNVIDLANFYSCSFIATQDLGRMFGPNTFELLGRFDNSDIRGCNLLVY